MVVLAYQTVRRRAARHFERGRARPQPLLRPPCWRPQATQSYACLPSALPPNVVTRVLSTLSSDRTNASGSNGLPHSRWTNAIAHTSLTELARAVAQRQPDDAWAIFAELRAQGATELISTAHWRQLVGLLAFSHRAFPQRESGLTVEGRLKQLHNTMTKAMPIQEPKIRQRLREVCKTWLAGHMEPLADSSHSATRSATPATLDIFTAASARAKRPMINDPEPIIDWNTRLLLYAFHRLRDANACLDVITQAHQRQRPLGIVEANAALLACHTFHDFSLFERVLTAIHDWQLDWDQTTYGLVISVSIQAGDMDKARRHFDTMLEHFHVSDPRPFCDLIRAYANLAVYGTTLTGVKTATVRQRLRQGLQSPASRLAVGQVRALFTQMRQLPQLVWDYQTTTALVQAFATLGEVETCWALFYEALTHADASVDFEPFSPVLVDDCLATYRSSACYPNNHAWSIMITALIEANKPQRIAILYDYLAGQAGGGALTTDDMALSRLPGRLGQLAPVLLTDFMRGLAKLQDKDRVLALFAELCRRNEPVAPQHVNKILSAFRDLGEMPLLWALYRHLVGRGAPIEPPMATFSSAPLVAGDLDTTHVVRQFVAAQTLDGFAFSIVLNACMEHNCLDWVAAIAADLQRYPVVLKSAVVRTDLIMAYSLLHDATQVRDQMHDWVTIANATPSAKKPGHPLLQPPAPLIPAPASSPDTPLSQALLRPLALSVPQANRLLVALARVKLWPMVLAMLGYLTQHLHATPDADTRQLVLHLALGDDHLPVVRAVSRLIEPSDAIQLRHPIPDNSLAFELFYHAKHRNVTLMNKLLAQLQQREQLLSILECNYLLRSYLKLSAAHDAYTLFEAMLRGHISHLPRFASKTSAPVSTPAHAISTWFHQTLMPIEPEQPVASGTDQENISLAAPNAESYSLLLAGFRRLQAIKPMNQVIRALQQQKYWMMHGPNATLPPRREILLLTPEVLTGVVVAHGTDASSQRLRQLLNALVEWRERAPITITDEVGKVTTTAVRNALVIALGQHGAVRESIMLFNDLHQSHMAFRAPHRPATRIDYQEATTGATTTTSPERTAIPTYRHKSPAERLHRSVKRFLKIFAVERPNPDDGTYTAMLSAAIHNDQTHLVPSIIHAYGEADLPPSSPTYDSFIGTALRKRLYGDITGAILPQMANHGLIPSCAVTGQLVHALCAEGREDYVQKLLIAPANQLSRLDLSEVGPEAPLPAFSGHPRNLQAAQWGLGMLPVDRQSLGMLLNAWAKRGEMDKITELLERMVAFAPTSESTVNLMPSTDTLAGIFAGFIAKGFSRYVVYGYYLLLQRGPSSQSNVLDLLQSYPAVERMLTFIPHREDLQPTTQWPHLVDPYQPMNHRLILSAGFALINEVHPNLALHLWRDWEAAVRAQTLEFYRSVMGTRPSKDPNTTPLLVSPDSAVQSAMVRLGGALIAHFARKHQIHPLKDMAQHLLQVLKTQIAQLVATQEPLDLSFDQGRESRASPKQELHPYLPLCDQLLSALAQLHQLPLVHEFGRELLSLEQDTRDLMGRYPALAIKPVSHIIVGHLLTAKPQGLPSDSTCAELVDAILQSPIPLTYLELNRLTRELVQQGALDTVVRMLQQVVVIVPRPALDKGMTVGKSAPARPSPMVSHKGRAQEQPLPRYLELPVLATLVQAIKHTRQLHLLKPVNNVIRARFRSSVGNWRRVTELAGLATDL
ncbi:hypothetical protein H4R35_001472 [Dimargaris xerosporica]|nr:hypothetical protein H4R35_001472 [Dimargaris xerosporica]